jgi:hypothetical protein
VRNVIVDGQMLMRERQMLNVDERQILEAARLHSKRLISKLE